MNLKKIDYFSLAFILINIFLLFISEPKCDSGGCAYFYVLYAIPSLVIGIFFYLLFRKIESKTEESVVPISDLNDYRIIQDEKKRKIIYWILNLNLLFQVVVFLIVKMFDIDMEQLVGDSFLALPYFISSILLLAWIIIPVEFIRLQNIQRNLLKVKSFIRIISYVLYFGLWIFYTFMVWSNLY